MLAVEILVGLLGIILIAGIIAHIDLEYVERDISWLVWPAIVLWIAFLVKHHYT